MALVPYPDNVAAEPRQMIDRFEAEHGRPSLLRQMLAWFPPALAALDGCYHPIMGGGVLPRETKELLLAAAADARRCQYCAGGHSRYLVEEFGFVRDDVIAMRAGSVQASLSDRDRLLVDFVRKVAVTPERTTPADVDGLRELGLTPNAIVEAISVAMLAAWTTTAALALHLEDDLVGPAFEGYF